MIIYQRGEQEFKGNLHAHTSLSDGLLSPLQVAAAYRERGYDFLALTDHRSRTKLDGVEGLTLLPGVELDFIVSDRECVHLLAIGGSPDVAGIYERGLSVPEAVKALKEAGALVYLAHPHWSMNRLETAHALKGLDGAEIFNAISRPPYNPYRAEATQFLDLLAADGLLYPTLATDDSHFYDKEAFTGFIYVDAASASAEDLLLALKEKRYYASQGPRFDKVEVVGDRVKVACSKVRTIAFHSNLFWNNNRCVTGEGITEGEYLINRAQKENFIRVILEDENGQKAWLNPFSV